MILLFLLTVHQHSPYRILTPNSWWKMPERIWQLNWSGNIPVQFHASSLRAPHASGMSVDMGLGVSMLPRPVACTLLYHSSLKTLNMGNLAGCSFPSMKCIPIYPLRQRSNYCHMLLIATFRSPSLSLFTGVVTLWLIPCLFRHRLPVPLLPVQDLHQSVSLLPGYRNLLSLFRYRVWPVQHMHARRLVIGEIQISWKLVPFYRPLGYFGVFIGSILISCGSVASIATFYSVFFVYACTLQWLPTQHTRISMIALV